MHISYKDFRTRVLLALLAIVVLIVAGTAVLDVIWKEYRRNIAGQMTSNVETLSRMLELLQHDSVARVRRIADESRHKELAARLVTHPDETALHDEFEAWITPLYQSRGFDDYSLISADGKRVMTAGTRPYIGQLPLPSTRETLQRAELLLGGAVTPPIPATRPFSTLMVENPSAYAYQLSCAPVDLNGQRIAFLCLHENPSLRLYRPLRDGRPGVTGEAYVVDQEGNILSPIRFEKNLAAPKGAEPGWSLFQLSARTMPLRDDNGLADPALLSTEPFTRVVERLLEHDTLDTGLLENYADYRGRRVVGAGRWLPDAALGLIIEEDMDEAFRSYYFARAALITMISLGSMLIVLLTYADWRSRRSLARSEQRLAAFRDYIPAGMNMKSSAGRYLMANPVFEASFNFPSGHVLGKTDAELFPPQEAAMLKAEHDAVLHTGRPITHNITKSDTQGRLHTYSIVRFPVRGEKDGSVVAVGMAALDISELIRTQRDLEELTQTLENKVTERTEQLAAARDLAETASRAKAEFLANMSHEIRTPLNAIIGMSHLAARVNADPRVGHYIGRIQSSSQHLLGVVNDILDLSKIEAGKLQVDVAEFALEDLLEQVAGLVSEQADAKGLELIIAIEPGLPARLIGDSMRIGQILINFANNAVKFTEQGEVVLRVRQLDRGDGQITLRFEVEDTGIGIAGDQLPLLFAPFQQLDGSMSRRFEGTGLGLAISRNLAALMEGAVSVSSHPGQGSTFALELALRIADPISPSTPAPIGLRDPMVDDPAHAHRKDTSDAFESWDCLAGRAILLVEDNPINQEVVHDLLAMVGARVTIASDGVQGIELLHGQPFDLVLMDIHMPHMDGFEATAAIRKEPRFATLPIIALTANALEGDLERCLAAGMNDYIAKPIHPDQLFTILARYLLALPAPEAACPEEASHPGQATAPGPHSAKDEAILAGLAGIAGIDVEQALARMLGRHDLYAQLACRIAAERVDMVEKLEAALCDNDRDAMLEQIHSAKSVLGMLGADALQQRCVDLQKHLLEGGPVEDDIAAFAAELAALLQRLQEVT